MRAQFQLCLPAIGLIAILFLADTLLASPLAAAANARSIVLGGEPELANAGLVTVGSLLRQEATLDSLTVRASWTAHLDSSYDHTGGNADSNNYLSVTGDVATLADLTGPGAVVRIWSANPGPGTLNVYIDDNPIPAVSLPFDELLSGKTDPFLAPMTQVTMGGHWTYLPIPYSKHCRITVDHPGNLYYQINSIRFSESTMVHPFALPLVGDDHNALVESLRAWSVPPHTEATNIPTSTVETIAAGKTADIVTLHGPGVMRQLTINASKTTDLELRRLVLRIAFDGHTTPDIEAPVADFFGNAYGHATFDSLMLSQTATGDMICRLPMPFGKSAQISIENGSARAVALSMTASVLNAPFDPAKTLYLHADFSQSLTVRGKPHTWFHVSGQVGRMAGVVQAMESPNGLGFLEGDEQVRVDGETMAVSRTPSTVIAPWNGTGTEDFFDSGWYFGGPLLAAPLHGCLVKDDNGRIDAFRFFINDAPIFQNSIDAQLEHGGANNAPNNTYYSSVAYWYGSGGRIPVSSMPAASALTLPISPTPRFALTMPGVVEGESLTVGAIATAGNVAVQSMGQFQGSWSHNAQLFWQTHNIGDTLTLHTTIQTAGQHDIVGYFTKARDYGMYTFSIGGQSLPTIFDGYNADVINSEPVTLGTITLPVGPVDLKVTVIGKNPLSSDYYFGLDALVVR